MSRFRINAQKVAAAVEPELPPITASGSTAAAIATAPDLGRLEPDGVALPALPSRKRSRRGDALNDEGNGLTLQDGYEASASATHAIVPFGAGAAIEDQANAPYIGGAGAPPMARPVAETKHGLRQFVVSQHGVRVFIHNCVSTCNLTCSNPDMAYIATHVRNAEYNPQRFSAVIIRLREPKSTALFFHSGKLVITGTRNEDDGRVAARLVGKIVHKLGFKCALADFKVQNIVCSGDIGFPVRLEGLADEHSKFASYEPELFPGLVYRMASPRIVFLIFVSGKFVVTAAKSRSTIIDAVNKLYPALFAFRKVSTAIAPVGLDAEAAIKLDSRPFSGLAPADDDEGAGGFDVGVGSMGTSGGAHVQFYGAQDEALDEYAEVGV